MPARDGTGPIGQGPRTGRQMGNCEGAEPMGKGLGPCGRGFARGQGRGFRNWTQPAILTKEEQKKVLEAEKKEIEKKLKELDETKE